MLRRPEGTGGFTLIELSIVLVIIGLIVGGVLVGQDLVRSAAVRAQISQIERYQQAVATFYGKYQGLPGDLAAGPAAQFGFTTARGGSPAQGDGNGVLESNQACFAMNTVGEASGFGETAVFWVDLSQAGLIDGGFNTANETALAGSSNIDKYFPQAKIRNGNYVYVWSGGAKGCQASNGVNYFGLSAITAIGAVNSSTPGLTVAQANSIDSKFDDGLPQSGRVVSFYTAWQMPGGSAFPIWAAGSGTQGAATSTGSGNGPTTAATAGSATTCYDNGNSAGVVQKYSVGQSGGTNVNCALSFQFAN